MNKWIGPTVKQLWNYAMHCCINLFEININATAFCFGRSSLHLLLLKSYMTRPFKMRRAKIAGQTDIAVKSGEIEQVLPSFKQPKGNERNKMVQTVKQRSTAGAWSKVVSIRIRSFFVSLSLSTDET